MQSRFRRRAIRVQYGIGGVDGDRLILDLDDTAVAVDFKDRFPHTIVVDRSDLL